MSDFAKGQLLKYGWTEGKGLGKNENGISQPLKPKLKFDTSGVGHKDNEFHWWDTVYDKALKNIVLETNSDEVSINVAKENAFNISSSKVGVEVSKKKHKLQYGKFLKTSTLQNGNMVKDETCEELEEDNLDDPTEIKMTDEELFKACGGRTAHKGARHGLTLSGKLARIAEQEKQLLAVKYIKSSEKPKCTEVKHKKKKKRKRDMEVDVEDCTTNTDNNDFIIDNDNCLELQNSDADYKPSKKTRLKSKRKVNDLVNQLNTSWTIGSNSEKDDQINDTTDTKMNSTVKIKKKGKKKKSKWKHNQEVIVVDNSDELAEAPQKRKKRKIVENHGLEKNENDVSDITIVYECTTIDVDKINDKIMRKKRRKFEKKQEKKLEQLSKSLLAVNLDNIQSEAANEITFKHNKKKWKKEKKHKKERNHKKEKNNEIEKTINSEQDS